MSDDWKVGDLAVCIDVSTSPRSPKCVISLGRIYRIVYVDPEESPHDIFGTDGGGLSLFGVVDSSSLTGQFAAKRFKKLPPASDEFSAQMRAIKPQRERQPA